MNDLIFNQFDGSSESDSDDEVYISRRLKTVDSDISLESEVRLLHFFT